MLNVEHFAKQLRKCRTDRGITQSGLARQLSLTPQSISKWERGEGMPDLENLCALARFFSVTIDFMVNNTSIQPRTFIGMEYSDRIRCALFSEQGQVLNSFTMDLTSNVDLAILDLIIQCLDRLHPTIMNTQSVYIIKRGSFHTDPSTDWMTTKLSQQYPGIRFSCCGIANAVLDSAGTPQETTLAVIGGITTCATYLINGTTCVRTGRGGLLARPAGSLYNIGQDAIIATCEQEDQIGEETSISSLLLPWLGDAPIKNYINSINSAGPYYISTFSRFVTLAAEQGDRVALSILRTNAQRLADLIQKSCHRSPQVKHVALGGTLLTATNDTFYHFLLEYLDSDLHVIRLTTPPIYEACLRAAQLGGVPDNFVLPAFDVADADPGIPFPILDI